ncbi:MAG TPA: hypothetical protein VG148_11305, partial [Pyrinomonadaceae bacterium]|nr:hypothetical protein [Pyrinomonadaceae bacterium]
YSFLLLPFGNVRGEGTVNQVKIPAGESVVEFHLQLIEETGPRRYQATLGKGDGPAAGTWTNLKPSAGRSGKIIRVPVPTKLLSPGAHRLTLAGYPSRGPAQIINTYDFRVVE